MHAQMPPLNRLTPVHACGYRAKLTKGFRCRQTQKYGISHSLAGRPYNTLALPCEHVITNRKLHMPFRLVPGYYCTRAVTMLG